MIYSSLPVPAMFIYPLSTEYPFEFIPRKPLQNDEAPTYTLTVPAAEKVMSKKFFVWETLDFLRAKLDVVLRKYNYQHPWVMILSRSLPLPLPCTICWLVLAD